MWCDVSSFKSQPSVDWWWFPIRVQSFVFSFEIQSKSQHSESKPHELALLWESGLEPVKKNLKATTQPGLCNTINQLHWHNGPKQWQDRYNWLTTRMYANVFYSSEPTLLSDTRGVVSVNNLGLSHTSQFNQYQSDRQCIERVWRINPYIFAYIFMAEEVIQGCWYVILSQHGCIPDYCWTL